MKRILIAIFLSLSLTSCAVFTLFFEKASFTFEGIHKNGSDIGMVFSSQTNDREMGPPFFPFGGLNNSMTCMYTEENGVTLSTLFPLSWWMFNATPNPDPDNDKEIWQSNTIATWNNMLLAKSPSPDLNLNYYYFASSDDIGGDGKIIDLEADDQETKDQREVANSSYRDASLLREQIDLLYTIDLQEITCTSMRSPEYIRPFTIPKVILIVYYELLLEEAVF